MIRYSCDYHKGYRIWLHRWEQGGQMYELAKMTETVTEEDHSAAAAALKGEVDVGKFEKSLEESFTIKDSGKREQFTSGMVRDVADDKVDNELIFNGPMADRWAAHLTKGAKKYPDVELGVPNWTLAEGQAELVRARKSAARHFRQWLRGDVDEDHAAATFFNINLAEYVKAKMDAPSAPQTVDEALRKYLR